MKRPHANNLMIPTKVELSRAHNRILYESTDNANERRADTQACHQLVETNVPPKTVLDAALLIRALLE